MSAEKPLNVVICWHMHQPQYRDQGTGTYLRPWTYLHTIKDYTDMAAHLASVPNARAVVNFVPILLEQIQDYVQQLDNFFSNNTDISDPLLNCLARGVPQHVEERVQVVKQCMHANQDRVIDRFGPYRRLVDIGRQHVSDDNFTGNYLNSQFFADLVVWYHIAWLGETVRRQDRRVHRLIKKEKNFSQVDCIEMVEVIADLMAHSLSQYRTLAQSGHIELAMSPYAHPMLPLLADFRVARQSVPDAPLPALVYPGGPDRIDWHLRTGREVFARIMGVEPAGCWPSEGGVSDEVLVRLKEHGFRWYASGQAVLDNSLRRAGVVPESSTYRYRAYQFRDTDLHGFFRDDALSDAIGFEYADWHADDAVGDLTHKLDQIAQHTPTPGRHIVSIIMDGENAWEYFPENGYHFIRQLYEALTNHPRLKLTTYSEYLQSCHNDRLDSLSAGSWVYGTFATWIGQADKNRAWEILTSAKKQCDRVLQDPSVPADRKLMIERQLACCEGSDWFWWFGDDNPVETVNEFAMIYRRHIEHLYALLGLQPPHSLSEDFGHGGYAEHGGVMRRGQH